MRKPTIFNVGDTVTWSAFGQRWPADEYTRKYFKVTKTKFVSESALQSVGHPQHITINSYEREEDRIFSGKFFKISKRAKTERGDECQPKA